MHLALSDSALLGSVPPGSFRFLSFPFISAHVDSNPFVSIHVGSFGSMAVRFPSFDFGSRSISVYFIPFGSQFDMDHFGEFQSITVCSLHSISVNFVYSSEFLFVSFDFKSFRFIVISFIPFDFFRFLAGYSVPLISFRFLAVHVRSFRFGFLRSSSVRFNLILVVHGVPFRFISVRCGSLRF